MLKHKSKPKLLIFTDWFAPGYKAGGPIQSLVNLSMLLQKHVEIFVLTSDTDWNEITPYSTVTSNEWVQFDEHIKVKYLSKDQQTYKDIRREIEAISPHTVYLNSMYSRVFTLFPLFYYRLRKLPTKVILAPRGMLQAGSLQFKATRKKAFLEGMKRIGMYNEVFFHATTPDEAERIKQLLNISSQKLTFISNVPPLPVAVLETIQKRRNTLSLLFIGRVTPVKNLLFLLTTLKKLEIDDVSLSIVGAIDDESYWMQCRAIIEQLRGRIQINYLGALPHSEVISQLVKHHVMILPTHGENFGHAIFEAFSQGRPVIISDKTPWRNLEAKKVGFDIPLDAPEKFLKAIERFWNMEQESFDTWSEASHTFAKTFVASNNLEAIYVDFFTS